MGETFKASGEGAVIVRPTPELNQKCFATLKTRLVTSPATAKSKSKSESLEPKSKSKSSKNGLKSGLESKSGLEYYKSAKNAPNSFSAGIPFRTSLGILLRSLDFLTDWRVK